MMERGLTRPGANETLVPSQHSKKKHSHDGKIRRRSTMSNDNRKVSAVTESRMTRWVQSTAVIYAKTGISEVGLFFQKFSNW